VLLAPGQDVVLRRSADPGELVLPDPSISRSADGVAALRIDNGDVVLVPGAAANPILLNGVKVTEPRPLRIGDRIRLGYTVVVVQAVGPPGEGDGSEVRTVSLTTSYVQGRDQLVGEADRLAQWVEGFDQMRVAQDEQEVAAVVLQQLTRIVQGDRAALAARPLAGDNAACRELAACGLTSGEVERVLRWLAGNGGRAGVLTPLVREVLGGDLPGRVAVGRLDLDAEAWLFYLEPDARASSTQLAYRALSVLANMLQLRDLFHQQQSQRRLIGELSETVRAYARPPEQQEFDIVQGKFVFCSQAMRAVCRSLTRAAAASSPVLLLGEPGTGKQLAAEALHAAGQRRHKELVTVSLAEYPDTLVESALFGQVKGAFTGATFQKGLVTHADDSTLFLDEIGEVPLPIQAKLLRVLERGELRRLGEPRVTKVDVRLITATNRNLQQEVREGRFRQDLYDRISVIPIVLPPLRERPEDIPVLAAHFLDEFNARAGKEVRLTAEGIRHLHRYTWPDNVRGLRNYIERAVTLADFGPCALGPDELPPFHPAAPQVEAPDRVEEAITRLRELARLNQARILTAFRDSAERLSKGEWADRVGISRPVFRSELQKLIAFALGRGISLEFFERRLTLRPEDWQRIQALRDESGGGG
jgi:transcriptional regulator with GAF, ATPase, and Fis domain